MINADEGDVGDVCLHIQAVMQVFNTVLSCLRSPGNQSVSFLPPESATWFDTVYKCLTAALGRRCDEDILVSGQQVLLDDDKQGRMPPQG